MSINEIPISMPEMDGLDRNFPRTNFLNQLLVYDLNTSHFVGQHNDFIPLTHTEWDAHDALDHDVLGDVALFDDHHAHWGDFDESALAAVSDDILDHEYIRKSSKVIRDHDAGVGIARAPQPKKAEQVPEPLRGTPWLPPVKTGLRTPARTEAGCTGSPVTA